MEAELLSVKRGIKTENTAVKKLREREREREIAASGKTKTVISSC